MKRILAFLLAFGLLLVTGSAWASDTSAIVSARLGNSANITPNRWHRNFTKAKAWAVANGVPFIAVWSNGESCPHCVKFENCCNQTVFKNWMAESGVVFWFGYSGDSEYPVGCTAFHWARNNKNTSYPFVRIYWPAGKVDVATTGDAIEGYTSGTAGAKKVVSYFKSKLSKWTPVDKNLPYTIAFDANLPTNYVATAGDVTEMASVETVYTNAVKATSAFKVTDFAITGWSLTAAGAVKYADGASLTKLTTTSNATVTLYAQWACDPYAIELDPNFTSGTGDVPQTVSLTARYGTAVTLPTKPFTRADYAFAGWATTPTGSVVYKDAASVKFTTKTDVVTLYAKWTKTTYRTYYIGKKYSISTGLKGYVAKTTFPGMTWNKTTGYFAGTPKTANATDPAKGTGLKVKFVKGSTTVYRYFVVVKDALTLASDVLTGSTAEFTTSDDDVTFDAAAVSGGLSNVSAKNLPNGMTCSAAGVISGRPTAPGTYKVTVTGTGASGLTLSATYTFVVAEGNQLVLGNFVHADKMFVDQDAELKLALDFVDKDNNAYDIYKESSGVELLDVSNAVVGDTVSTLALTQDETTGKFWLTGSISEAGTYTMKITVWSVDDAFLTQTLKVIVLAAQSE